MDQTELSDLTEDTLKYQTRFLGLFKLYRYRADVLFKLYRYHTDVCLTEETTDSVTIFVPNVYHFRYNL